MERFLRGVMGVVMALGVIAGMAGVRVTDMADGKPVEGATVISSTGVLLGLTDANGELSKVSGRDYPLSIRCLGYEAAEISDADGEVSLIRSQYELPEYTVTAGERPVSRMICKVREYTTAATDKDTLIMYCEHMGDIFYAKDKVKGFKQAPRFRRLATKYKIYVTDHEGEEREKEDSKYSDEVSWLMLMDVPVRDIEVSEKVASGASADTIMGKYSPRRVLRNLGGMVMQTDDMLGDQEGHHWDPFLFKLVGMTVDFNELQTSTAYHAVENGKLTPEQMAYGTFSVKALGKGKWLKKMLHSSEPIEMNGYFEYYPIDIERMTADEAKELQKHPETLEFCESPNELPLPPAIARLIEGGKE